jgi:hypothetical protein
MKKTLTLLFTIISISAFSQRIPDTKQYEYTKDQIFDKFVKHKDSIQATLYRQGGDTLEIKRNVRNGLSLKRNISDTINNNGVPTINRFKDSLSDLRTTLNTKQPTISNIGDTILYAKKKTLIDSVANKVRATSPLTANKVIIGGGGNGVGVSTVDITNENIATLGTLSLKNSGQDVATLGNELLTNGSFTSNLSYWTVGANWAWNTGGALHTTGSIETLTQSIDVTSGSIYQVAITMSGRTAGDITFQLGSLNYAFSSATSALVNTTEYKTFTATSSTTLAFTITPTSTFNGKIDDVSIKALTPNTVTSVSSINNSAGLLSSETRANVTLNNLFFGLNSGKSNSTGFSNMGYGNNCLANNTTGYQNNAQGFESMYVNTTGYSNTAIGSYSLRYNTDGSRNIGLGIYALYSNTTGLSNMGIGCHALQNGTTGNSNVAIGHSAMMNGINTGSYNVGISPNALNLNTSGSYNIAIGWQSLFANTTGKYNTAIGTQCLGVNVGNDYNTTVGIYSLASLNGGYQVTALGSSAGRSVTTSVNSLYLGYGAGYNASQKVDAANTIVIGYNAYSTTSNSVVLGNSSIITTQLRGRVISTGSFNVPSDSLFLIGGAKPTTKAADTTDARYGFVTVDDLSKKANLTGATFTGAVVNTKITSDSIDVKKIYFNHKDSVSGSGTYTLNLAGHNLFVFTPTNTTTLSYKNAALGTYMIEITNGATGYATTLASSKWRTSGGTQPTITAGNNGKTLLTCYFNGTKMIVKSVDALADIP